MLTGVVGLAGRGAGLVALAKPAAFNWPGYWLAVLGRPGPGAVADDATAVLMFSTPSGVVLSPLDPGLLGRAAADLPIREGYVLCGLDPPFVGPPRRFGSYGAVSRRSRWQSGPPAPCASSTTRGRSLAEAWTVTAMPPRQEPSLRPTPPLAATTSLIQAEVLDDLTLPDGRKLGYAEARRNVVTRGIDLNALVGRRFRVGNVECLGQRLCEPCSHLERLTTKGTLRGLIHRGGLRADVLSDGDITPGALIETVD